MGLEELADKVYKLLNGQNYDVVMFDDDGRKTLDTSQATRFFVEKPNIMVRVAVDAINMNKTANLPYEDIKPVAELMKELAHRNGYQFNVRVFGGSIVPKDFVHELRENKMIGKLYGKSKVSYQKVGENTVIVYRHSDKVNARARNSKICEIEINSHGEHYMMPTPHIKSARAMGVYLESGGKWTDNVGATLVELNERVRQVEKYRKYVKNRDPISAHLAGMTTRKINKAVDDFLSIDDDERVQDILTQMSESITAAGAVAVGGTGNGPYADKVEPLLRREKTPSNLNKIIKKHVMKDSTMKLPAGMIFENDSDAWEFTVNEMANSKKKVMKAFQKHLSEVAESYTDQDKAELVAILSNREE